ncbi:formate dehydrogenase accessory protein FdhE, partial [Candidatus Bathyarchaeota archaeon]|nr:formate dehydrogenase accessory protein FdhE [Candidatus Bathyarchaeota archaeon]
ISTLLSALFEGNEQKIIGLAVEFKVDANILVFLAQMLVQPWLEQAASMIDPSLLHRRVYSTCPICGVKPIVETSKEGKRFLLCVLCGLIFPAAPFSCIFCGNRDPYTLKSLFPENRLAFRIDYCEKCRCYTKVIIDQKLKERIPSGLEDLLTSDLDIIARSAGLLRIGVAYLNPTAVRHG